MNSKKTIFIIPGFRQNPTSKAYKKIELFFVSQGYTPVMVKLSWKNKTLTDNTELFVKKYKKVRSRNKYILGFSYGAMIAFIAGTKVTTKGLILCSLSPFFNEDVSKPTTRAVSRLGDLRYNDFLKLNSAKIAKNSKAKRIVMLYGTQEERSLIKRVKETFENLETKHKKLMSVKNTDHNIGDKKYLLTIQLAVQNLHMSHLS